MKIFYSCLIIILFYGIAHNVIIINNNAIKNQVPVITVPYVTRGIVSYYKLDENVGASTVADSWGTNTGTVHGLVQVAGGYINNCSSGSLTTDDVYIDLGKRIISGTGDFSIEMWVKTSLEGALPGYDYIYSQGLAGTGRLLINIYPTNGSDGKGQFQLSLTGADHTVDVGITVYDTWIHYVLVKESNVYSVYVNSVKKSLATDSTPIADDGQNSQIGFSAPGRRTVYGCMDELRIYNVALTQTEVNQNYALH